MKALAYFNGKSEIMGTDTFVSKNPARLTDELGTFACATSTMIADAVTRARSAFDTWKKIPAPVRAGVIANFGRLLGSNKEALARVITREMGKPIKEARGDVQEAIDTSLFFASEGRRLYGMTVPSELPQKECSTYRRPIGVFACITAGNFPVAVPSWYFVPALLCGNVCLWKCPEDAPQSSYHFTQLLYKAGCPPDVFQILFGGGVSSTGEWLVNAVDQGGINKFGFTGSSAVGQQIGAVCGRNLITACLELGGKNPMVVMEDANLSLAVQGAVWSGFGTAGQRCTSLGNLILHESIAEQFLKELLKKVGGLKIGDPMDESVAYGPMISEKFMNNHLQNLEKLIEPHHTLLTKLNGRITGKKPWQHWVGASPDQGLYCFPTIVSGVRPGDKIYLTETFGPLFNVMTCHDLGEAIRLANGTGYGLSSALYTQNPSHVYQWKEEIGAGMVSINNTTTGAEAHLPFGGNGRSGNGARQSGVWVLDQFTRWQAVNWDLSGSLQLAQMDTASIQADLDFKIPKYRS